MPGYHCYLLRGSPAFGQTTERRFKASRRRRAGKQALLDDGVDTPVAVDHLGDAEVDADGHERDRLILAQSLSGHQKAAHLAERIPQREIDRGFFVDHTLGKYIISDKPMTEEQWTRERATLIDVTPEK